MAGLDPATHAVMPPPRDTSAIPANRLRPTRLVALPGVDGRIKSGHDEVVERSMTMRPWQPCRLAFGLSASRAAPYLLTA